MIQSKNLTDILAIGAHPDDIELSCSGSLIKHIQQGKKVSMVDLTRGELGTRGSAQLRVEEAELARSIIGAEDRLNLGFRDGFFKVDEEHLREVVKVIRLKKPAIILCNAVDDRHPDHGKGAELVKQACFYSGLMKFETKWEGSMQEVHRPKALYHYIQFKYIRPDFLVDITAQHELKMKAIKAFSSQFYDPTSDEPDTLISSKGFLDFIEARMLEFGRIIGVKHAEGFTAQRIPGVEDLFSLT
ncbi:MAG: bacillithiol biosynthesis deacetylase BshB1 [Vicingaceae bacterium]